MAEAVVAAVMAAGVEVGTAIVMETAISWAAVAMAAGKAFAVTAIAGALREEAAPPSSAMSAQALKRSIRSAVAPRRIVYGTARLSGSLAYGNTTGTDNGELYLVVPFHAGEYDSVVETYLGEDPITDARFSGVAEQTLYPGTAAQTADADLIAATSDWTANHRLRGIGYSVVHLTWNATAYPHGIPNPSWVVKGRKLYDPRDASTAWSDNAALVILDYLIGTVPTASGTRPVGIGATLSEIDTDSFIAAANACDEAVALAAGGTQARYTCNGVVDLTEPRARVIERLLTSCAGTLVYSGGVYSLHVGAATVGTFALTSADLRDSLRLRPRESRGSAFNTLRGTYIDPDSFFEAADFAPQTDAAALAVDGEIISQDIDLSYTHNGIAAQRIARQLLLRASSQNQTLTLPLNWRGLALRVWDTGTVDLGTVGTGLGLDPAATWRCTSWKLADGGGVDVTLAREDSAAYDWATADEVAITTAKKPTVTDASIEDITGLTVGSASVQTSAGDLVGGLSIDWDDAVSAYIDSYDVEVLDNGTQAVVWSGRATKSAMSVPGLAIGTGYDVRVRARHVNGAIGDWTTVADTAPSGDLTSPGECGTIVATAGAGTITVSWVTPADADFAKVHLYRHTADDFGAASLLTTRYQVPGVYDEYADSVAAGLTRYYWPIAVDTSGNASTTPATVSATAL